MVRLRYNAAFRIWKALNYRLVPRLLDRSILYFMVILEFLIDNKGGISNAKSPEVFGIAIGQKKNIGNIFM